MGVRSGASTRKVAEAGVNLLAAADFRFSLSGNDAIDQSDAPSTFCAVDPHGNFGFARRVLDNVLEDEKIGPKLAHSQGVAVDA